MVKRYNMIEPDDGRGRELHPSGATTDEIRYVDYVLATDYEALGARVKALEAALEFIASYTGDNTEAWILKDIASGALAVTAPDKPV